MGSSHPIDDEPSQKQGKEVGEKIRPLILFLNQDHRFHGGVEFAAGITRRIRRKMIDAVQSFEDLFLMSPGNGKAEQRIRSRIEEDEKQASGKQPGKVPPTN